MSDKEKLQKEINDNYEFFKTKLPELLQSKSGKFVLLRNKEIKGFFDTILDALSAGKIAFKDEIFSIQEIKEDNINLGFFSAA